MIVEGGNSSSVVSFRERYISLQQMCISSRGGRCMKQSKCVVRSRCWLRSDKGAFFFLNIFTFGYLVPVLFWQGEAFGSCVHLKVILIYSYVGKCGANPSKCFLMRKNLDRYIYKIIYKYVGHQINHNLDSDI